MCISIQYLKLQELFHVPSNIWVNFSNTCFYLVCYLPILYMSQNLFCLMDYIKTAHSSEMQYLKPCWTKFCSFWYQQHFKCLNVCTYTNFQCSKSYQRLINNRQFPKGEKLQARSCTLYRSLSATASFTWL